MDIFLGYLVGKIDMEFDQAALRRMRDNSVLPEEDNNLLIRAIDGLLHDIKTQHAYA